MQAVMTEKMNKYASGGSFETTIGKTAYLVNVFFNKENKATLDERIKKRIRHDVMMGIFKRPSVYVLTRTTPRGI